MDTEIAKRLDEQAAKIDAVYASVEKTRKYFLWTMLVTLAFLVLPIIGLFFAVPSFLSNYIGTIESVGGY